MNLELSALVERLRAYAEQYEIDAKAIAGDPGKDRNHLSRFFAGKADAYFNAASWLEELGV